MQNILQTNLFLASSSLIGGICFRQPLKKIFWMTITWHSSSLVAGYLRDKPFFSVVHSLPILGADESRSDLASWIPGIIVQMGNQPIRPFVYDAVSDSVVELLLKLDKSESGFMALKKWNEPILMYIYHKQCVLNHTKKSIQLLKQPISVFQASYVRCSVLKTQKRWNTRETKTRFAQSF